MQQLSTAHSFLRFVRASGLQQLLGPRATTNAVREIQARLAQLAVDAHLAETRGLSFCDAVSDIHAFPHLTRFHAEIETFLQLPVPAPLDAWFERLVASPELPMADALRSGLVDSAVSHSSPPTRALARYLVFTGVWLNLRVLYLRDPALIIRMGVGADDLLKVAELVMRGWLAEPAPPEEGACLYQVLVSEAFVTLPAYGQLVREVYTLTRDDLDYAAQEALFAKMDGVEALLLRNHIAEANHVQKLSVDRLRELHPAVLADLSSDAVSQRLSRLLKRIRKGGLSAAPRPQRRLIDVLTGTPALTLEEA